MLRWASRGTLLNYRKLSTLDLAIYCRAATGELGPGSNMTAAVLQINPGGASKI